MSSSSSARHEESPVDDAPPIIDSLPDEAASNEDASYIHTQSEDDMPTYLRSYFLKGGEPSTNGSLGNTDPAAGPIRLTSDMRPPGDTSRKYIKFDEDGRAYAEGGRKSARARAWVWEVADSEVAAISVNEKTLSEFFGGHWSHRHTVIQPFLETGTVGKYSVKVKVGGGGLTGAHSYGSARAHTAHFPATHAHQGFPRVETI